MGRDSGRLRQKIIAGKSILRLDQQSVPSDVYKRQIVDNKTEIASVFDLSEKGGTYQFEKETDGIKQLAK